MSQLYPLLFHPNLHQLVWGSNRIREWKGLSDAIDNIGESWEVSAVKGKESIISNGDLAGKNLREICEEYGERLIGKTAWKAYDGKFPVLAKFIGAETDLSIQVHPDDVLAKERHDSLGKNEMWYIIDNKPGAKLFSGFKKHITKDEYKEHVVAGTICDTLQEHAIRKGDMFYIPAGRVHAIGGGILLAEIQQSSDITYRIYDYNRKGLDGKPRELHTEQAVDAIDFNVEKDYKTHYSIRHNKPSHAITCPFFQINILDINNKTIRHLKKCDSFIIYMCLKGACTIYPEQDKSKAITIQEGFSCLIPAEIADVVVTPAEGHEDACMLESFIDNYKPWYKRFMLRSVF
ncbi:MAG: class I mannose-6-phosphate isomerase [Prevotella sp.]|nr:class I mannose-6-phosphate isomerase [Candidatus Prevotella equi]